MSVLSLSACALSLQRGAEASEKSPLHISGKGKEGYFFSLRVARAWEEHNGKITPDPATATTQLRFTGPTCNKHTLLIDSRGDKTDFLVICRLEYTVQPAAENKKRDGILSERFILALDDNLNAYYRKEDTLRSQTLDRLAQKLVLTVKTVR